MLYLRDKATGALDTGLIAYLYRFKEVRQNWLGFAVLGNGGHALGNDFATALHASLGSILRNFGNEQVTRGTHLEKLCLIRGGVGRDNISDFTTNLIKHYLLDYTQLFARQHLTSQQCRNFPVTRAAFNYNTESWETRTYCLPALRDDFVLLTPADILTRDDTWISQSDMISSFDSLPPAIEDAQLRAQINNYFKSLLSRKPSAAERRAAAQATIRRYQQLVDYYIKQQEDEGDRAEAVSASKVADTYAVLVDQLQRAHTDLSARTDFYDKSWSSYDEVHARVQVFKQYVENQDGYKLINRGGEPFSREAEVQLFFGLLWCTSDFDINREVNNGRGPVDFKASFGAGDKSLIEFKLASNTSLARNLQKQVQIYEAANRTNQSLKVIVCYTAKDQARVAKILKDLKLENDESIILIDARSDNKPSASTA